MKLSFALLHPERELSGFDLGHVSVIGALGGASSVGTGPNQASMVFVGATELLDALSTFLGEQSKYLRFVFADSSFSLEFARLRDGQFEVVCAQQQIERMSAADLIKDTHLGCSEFLRQYLPLLPSSDPVRQDADEALSRFSRWTTGKQ
jgi:hypothetical protein